VILGVIALARQAILRLIKKIPNPGFFNARLLCALEASLARFLEAFSRIPGRRLLVIFAEGRFPSRARLSGRPLGEMRSKADDYTEKGS
jgi:hypothetical protein